MLWKRCKYWSRRRQRGTDTECPILAKKKQNCSYPLSIYHFFSPHLFSHLRPSIWDHFPCSWCVSLRCNRNRVLLVVNPQVLYCFVAKNNFTSSSFLEDCFAGDMILGWQLFSLTWKYESSVSWDSWLQLRNRLSVSWSLLFLRLLLRSSLHLCILYFPYNVPSEDLFLLFLIGIHWASWICGWFEF